MSPRWNLLPKLSYSYSSSSLHLPPSTFRLPPSTFHLPPSPIHPPPPLPSFLLHATLALAPAPPPPPHPEKLPLHVTPSPRLRVFLKTQHRPPHGRRPPLGRNRLQPPPSRPHSRAR